MAGPDAVPGLAGLQARILAALDGQGPLDPDGPAVSLADLHLARGADGLALDRRNLAAGLQMPPGYSLAAPDSAAPALAFTGVELVDRRLRVGLAIEADAGAQRHPLNAVTLEFEQRDGDWRLAAPPAQLAT